MVQGSDISTAQKTGGTFAHLGLNLPGPQCHLNHANPSGSGAASQNSLLATPTSPQLDAYPTNPNTLRSTGAAQPPLPAEQPPEDESNLQQENEVDEDFKALQEQADSLKQQERKVSALAMASKSTR
ncbi:hypothetical protein M422DRAFT_256871 [Sphaerobolus stellatus SS14]|uniref:Uncharacterized protein n=1 Tax=Sphaerobolus stellatus (strain SS14) TaxID=990650 RepID=A0A0C9VQ35_SPHS4|nr:hypothetical protein M422DRAFT_256871 [Sphaerobolus stellatus SS14]